MSSGIETVFKRHGIIVSRETLDKLDVYQRLLVKWQKAINLVGPATLDDIVSRHFLDSAQVIRALDDTNVRLADMGSGAGFPGLVLAMMGVRDVHLIESDVRKATFLREVSRETSTSVTIHDRRIEDTEIADIDVFTARALAPLRDILGHIVRLATPERAFYCVLMKGMQYQEEIDKARKQWVFDVDILPSETDVSGKMLKISGLVKK
jgi:16S rRNA (guanine527-N7)-methyltransferase